MTLQEGKTDQRWRNPPFDRQRMDLRCRKFIQRHERCVIAAGPEDTQRELEIIRLDFGRRLQLFPENYHMLRQAARGAVYLPWSREAKLYFPIDCNLGGRRIGRSAAFRQGG